MCPTTRPRLGHSVAALATALVAVCGAAATIFATPVAEPGTALVASTVVASASASPR